MTDEEPMRYVLASELTDKEIYLIGQILVGWGTLEFTIFNQTLDTFEATEIGGSGLPRAMNNLQFTGVLNLWEERVLGITGEERSRELRKQLKEIRELKPARDALVHGMWDYSREDISRISTVRIRKKEIIEFHFTADDLQDFQQRLGTVNFAIRYPGGRNEYFEEVAAGDGFVSRRFLALVSGSEIARDWQANKSDPDELDSEDDD